MSESPDKLKKQTKKRNTNAKPQTHPIKTNSLGIGSF